MSEFSFPGSQLGGGVVKHVADLHKKPGKGAVEVYVYVDSIEETVNVRSLTFSFIRAINRIRVLVDPMHPRTDQVTLIENQGGRRKATGRESARRK